MCNNIVLIGFMGSGKTTIGRMLANKLNNFLIDTDDIIELNYDIKISDFFQKFGEIKFRELEISLCKWIKTNIKNSVISTGGGMPIIYNMRDMGNVIYLDITFEEIQKRIINDGIQNRPMIKDFKQLHSLYNERIQIYKNMAHYIVNASDSKNNIVDKIYNYLKG